MTRWCEARRPLSTEKLDGVPPTSSLPAGFLPRASFMSFSASLSSFSPSPPNSQPPAFSPHLSPRQHGECPRRDIPVGNPRRHRRSLHPELHLRCQGWHTRSYFRPPIRREGRCLERGHTFSHSMVTKSNHLRCTDEAAEHIYHNRKQGFADGELDVEGTTSTRGQDVTKDLSGMFITVFYTCCRADFVLSFCLNLEIK
jgi:hypothetical protein